MTTTTRELLGIFVLLGSFLIDTLFGRLTTLISLAIFAPITLLLGLGNVISVALLMKLLSPGFKKLFPVSH